MGAQGFVAFVFDDAVLVEAGYQVAAVVGYDDVEGDELRAQGVADAAEQVVNAGTVEGAFQFEYAPHGTAVGLCVSDPGGGWSSDPLRDGLILTPCNTGPWQQFIPQSNGTLKNVATGLYVNPNGRGGQLRGGTSPTPWGGSSYTWRDHSSLPG